MDGVLEDVFLGYILRDIIERAEESRSYRMHATNRHCNRENFVLLCFLSKTECDSERYVITFHKQTLVPNMLAVYIIFLLMCYFSLVGKC